MVKVEKGRIFAYQTSPIAKNLHMDVCGNCNGELPNYPRSKYCLHCGSKLIYGGDRDWK